MAYFADEFKALHKIEAERVGAKSNHRQYRKINPTQADYLYRLKKVALMDKLDAVVSSLDAKLRFSDNAVKRGEALKLLMAVLWVFVKLMIL